MKRRIICLILTISMLLSLLPAQALTTTPLPLSSEIWNGSIAAAFAGGNGSETDPFQISNGAELAYFAELVNTGKKTNGYYILTQDIYLNDISNFNDWSFNPPANKWTPIGSRISNDYSYWFEGNFDGNGYGIYGAYINKEDLSPMGLFGTVSKATISNLNVIDCYFTGTNCIGGIAGISKKTLFYNCYSRCLLQGNGALGGIVGADDRGTFRYCCNEGDITATIDGAGGIVGFSHGEASNFSTGTIQYCYNSGDITGVSGVGGITGAASYISDCYNIGTVTLHSRSAGGIAGTLTAIAETGNNYIDRCYNAGKILSTNSNGDPEEIKIGALIGNREVNAQLSNSYYLDTTAEYDIGLGGWYRPSNKNALTDAEMRDPNNFIGFDFTSVWYIDKNSDYPYPQLAFPDETRRYAILSVADVTTNDPITDFTVNLDSSNGLVYAEVDGIHYIVGNGSAFDSNTAIEIHADGYEPFLFDSQDLKNSISLRYAPNNVLYLSPVGSDSSALDELKQTYILAHKQFFQNEYSDLVQNYGFKNALWQYDNGENFYLATIGNWLDNINDIVTLSFDDIQFKVSYYEQFLIDLMSIMTEVEAEDPLDISNLQASSTVLSWVTIIDKINKDKSEIFETPDGLERWNEIWEHAQIAASNGGTSVKEALYDEAIEQLSLPDGSGDGYFDKFMQHIQGYDVLEKDPTLLNSIFKSASIAETATSHIANATSSINAFRDTTSAYITVSTYASIHENLFAVLKEAATSMDTKYADGILDVMNKYTLDPENQGEFYTNFIKDLANDTGNFVYDIFLQDKIQDISYNVIGKIINCPISIIKVLTASIQIGHFFGEGLTGLGGRSEQYTIIYYVAPLEEALEEIVQEYGEQMIKSGTYEDAQRFEYAYRTLAATNQYLYKCYWAMGANETGFGVGDHHVGQMSDVMEYGASMQNLWKKTNCHGDTHIVNNKFKYTSIQCPVDVYVYDESNNLVVSIVDEQVVKNDPAFTVLVLNGKKSLVYPEGHDYQIKIVPRDNGVMNYLVSEINDHHIRHIDSYNIPISNNQEFIGQIPSEFNIAKTSYALKSDGDVVSTDYDSNEGERTLDTPTEIDWKDTSASWKAVDHATGYSVGIYRNGQQIALTDTLETSVDLQSYMTEDGRYAFYVIAIGDGDNYANSRKSANSREFEFQSSPESGYQSDLDAVKSAIMLHDWTTEQSVANTHDALIAWIDGKLKEMALNNVNYTISITEFTKAVSGSPSDQDGTNGEFIFKVVLSKGEGVTCVTDTVTMAGVITASQFSEEHPSENYPSGGGSSDRLYTVSILSTNNGLVSASSKSSKSGAAVTIFVTPNEGYMLNSLTVNDVNGNSVPITQKEKDKYTFIMPASQVTILTIFSPILDPELHPYDLPFTDILASDWYVTAVEYVYHNNLMVGLSDSIFAPNKAMTRGMIVTILYRLEGNPITAPSNFKDVPMGQYYTDAVAWASSNHIVSGYGNGLFGPNDILTREQLVTILYRYIGEPAVSSNIGNYIDSSSISDYAQPAMNWAISNSIISGYTNNILIPQGNATRAEVATILMRLLNNKI